MSEPPKMVLAERNLHVSYFKLVCRELTALQDMKSDDFVDVVVVTTPRKSRAYVTLVFSAIIVG